MPEFLTLAFKNSSNPSCFPNQDVSLVHDFGPDWIGEYRCPNGTKVEVRLQCTGPMFGEFQWHLLSPGGGG